MRDKSYDTVHCDVIKTTEKAVLVFEEDNERELWIPRSVIEDGESVEEDEDLDLNVESWFCEKEGL